MINLEAVAAALAKRLIDYREKLLRSPIPSFYSREGITQEQAHEVAGIIEKYLMQPLATDTDIELGKKMHRLLAFLKDSNSEGKEVDFLRKLLFMTVLPDNCNALDIFKVFAGVPFVGRDGRRRLNIEAYCFGRGDQPKFFIDAREDGVLLLWNKAKRPKPVLGSTMQSALQVGESQANAVKRRAAAY